MNLKDNYLLLLCMICIAIFFVNLDAVMINIMEARNFTTAREMINLDNWIFTTINNEPRYEKPPLPTWLTAISMHLFGVKNLFALRLPAAIMGSITVIFVYKLGLKVTAYRKYAFIAGLIAATSFYILYAGRDGQWDIHTHAWMMLGIYNIYKILTEEGNKYLYGILAGLFIGCSFLSKGPVSMYTLLLPFLVAYGVVNRYRNIKNNWKPLFLMLFTAFIISASWSLYVYFLDTRAVAEITERETGRWLDYNVRPFYYYWSFVVQSGIWTIPALIGLLYPYLKNRVFNKSGYKFTLWWTLGSLVLLSIIPEKKSRYLLPVLIPLALNTAFYIEYLFRRFDMMPKKEKLVVYFNFSIIGIVGLAFPILGFYFLKDQPGDIWPWYIFLSICLVTIGSLMFFYLKRNRIKPVFYLTIWFIVSLIFFGFPILKNLELNPDYKSVSIVNNYLEKEPMPLYEFSGFTPELIWEYGKPIDDIKEGESYKFPKNEKFLLLVQEAHMREMKQALTDYRIEKLDEINMNLEPGKHRERLHRNLFLILKNKDND